MWSVATHLKMIPNLSHSNTYKLFGSVNVSVSSIKYSQNRTREMKIIQNVYFFYLSETPKAGEAEGKYYIVLKLIFYSLNELLYIILF